ncbi:MAG: hypothetical protein HRS50_01550 [Mycoplasmataceae bacterium]|nr:hypothetical protein [Mycoplasmataceae bacterium]
MKKIKVEKIAKSLENIENISLTKKEFAEFVENAIANDEKSVIDIFRSEPFTFDKKDKKWKKSDRSFVTRIYQNSFQNLWIVSQTMLKSFFTSGTGIYFLAIVTLISVLLINNLTGVSIEWGWIENPNGGGFESVITNIYTSQTIAHFTSAFVTPMLLLTCLFIPPFIVSLRSDSRMKRLGIYGISKEQFNISITLVSLMIVFLTMIIIYWPLSILGNAISSGMFQQSIQEVVKTSLEPFWLALIPLMFISTIAFTQAGIFLGNKMNQTKSVIFVGLAFFLLANLTSYGAGGLPDREEYLNNSLHTFYQFFRWIFVVTPYTILLQSLVLTISIPGSNSIPAAVNPDWVIWIVPLSLTIGTLFSIIPIVFSNKWIKFDGIR